MWRDGELTKNWPESMQRFWWWLKDPYDAMRLSEDMREYVKDGQSLLAFADWLTEQTDGHKEDDIVFIDDEYYRDYYKGKKVVNLSDHEVWREESPDDWEYGCYYRQYWPADLKEEWIILNVEDAKEYCHTIRDLYQDGDSLLNLLEFADWLDQFDDDVTFDLSI